MMFLECVSVAVVVWTFFEVLTGPGMVFEFWYRWMERLNNTGRSWLAKPLGYCGVCFAGQFGLWWYAVAHRADWVFGEHIIFTCQVIAFYLAIKRISSITEAWSNKLKKG